MTIDQLKEQVKNIVETHPRGLRWFIGEDKDQNPASNEPYPYVGMTPVRNNPTWSNLQIIDNYTFEIGCFDLGRVAPSATEKDEMITDMYKILLTILVELYDRGYNGITETIDGKEVETEWMVASTPIEYFQDEGSEGLFGYAATVTLTSNNSFDLCCNEALFS